MSWDDDKEECPSCDGSGKCSSCHSTGKDLFDDICNSLNPFYQTDADCNDCHGTGTCQRCNGDGEV